MSVVHRALELGVTLSTPRTSTGPYTNEELSGARSSGTATRRSSPPSAGSCPAGRVTTDDRDGSPDYVRAACDAALQRLGVDHVDLYQLHRVDPATPVEETWGAFAGPRRGGQGARIGLSEVTRRAARGAATRSTRWPRVQSELSLWTRDWTSDVLPWCRENGVAFLPYAPLGRGFLTGAMGAPFARDDFRSRPAPLLAGEPPRQPGAGRRRARGRRADGATPAQVALAWVLAQGERGGPDPRHQAGGAGQENAAAAGLVLSPRTSRELDALPAPVGGRY